MMGATGEPSGYYPTDSNGLPVGQTPPVACVCYVAASPMVCAPLEYGGCRGGRCEEVNSAIFLIAFGVCIPQVRWPPWVIDLASCLARCGELDQRCHRNALNDYEAARLRCDANKSKCELNCLKIPPDLREVCFKTCEADHKDCLADAAQAYADAIRACDTEYDNCRTQCYNQFAPKPEPSKKE
jgi:hypothetical protein